MKPPTLSVLYLIHLTSLLLILAESTQPPFSCDTSDPRTKSYLFCKTTLPITQRVQDLVSRLTLDEKLSQLVHSASPIPRLGIPAYQWWSEALHGVAYSLRVTQGIRFNGTIQSATSFPQVILTAACFDAHLWCRIAQAKASAIYNAGQATGMTFWAPNINIYRDPRWGRGQETPGGKLGQHLQASACSRGQWGFNGYITSDCDAVAIIHEDQGYGKLPEDAVADVLKAGMDVNCGTYLKKYTKSAVEKRKLPVSEIDRALHNLFSVRMRLGLFDGNPVTQPYGTIGSDKVCSQEHWNLALEAARKGIVLLKNTDKLLPLSKTKTFHLQILWAGYPGEAGGRALAEIIFGDHNPGGRLPVTWYPQSYVNVPMTDMRMRPEPSSSYPGRTYRFYQGPKAFEFGYGLSYSNYTYEILPVTQNKVHIMVESSNPNRYMPVSEMGAEACEKMKYTVKVRVKNHCEMAEERAEVEFELRPCEHLSSAKKDGSMVIEEGSYLLSIEDKESEIQVVK
ncbi:putative beta-D-xylosidase 7 -like protein [Gossypium arboreum]|uniref:Putative beta-D-xylosidase 7-like protein n=1 Tax=Gossypium arboreum TaxID=29729 RepID=A0A0B0PZN3_GOSAR|nr:putative beta-D-xylosidase 7 -like protein [Gossypium arboreum]